MSAPRSSLRRERFSLKSRRSESVDSRARGSYIPDRLRPSSEELRSRNSGVRKSSINLSEVKRKDARPLTDKAYQKRKIADLVAFLEEQDFKYPVSVPKLATPSKKDFEVIFQFLYNCFDPRYEVKKIEEEGPKILKCLGYPFTVNKSTFVYVARTNWPTLLGILIWLMDVNKFALNVDINSVFEIADGEGRAQVHGILLRYIWQRHHSGDDNQDDDSVFAQIIKSSIYIDADDIDELLLINKEKVQQLKNAEKELEIIKALSAEKTSLDQTVEKYEVYIKELKAHAEKKNGLRTQLLEQLKTKESQLKDLKDQIAVKQEAYDAQGFDGKKQLNYFESQKKELIEKLEKKQAVVKDLQDKIWDAEIQFNQELEKVNDAVDSFKELCNKTVENIKSIVEPLQALENPHMKQLCDNFLLSISSWEVPSHTDQSDLSSYQNSFLENMFRSITNNNELLQRMMKDFYSEKLNEIRRKKSELKLILVKDSQSEKDLNVKEKQTLDEVKSLEGSCETISKHINELQKERLQFENTQKEASDELKLLKAFCTRKAQEYNYFIKEHEQVYQDLLKTEQEVTQKILEYGNDIVQKLEDELV